MTQVILEDYNTYSSFCDMATFDGYHYERLIREDGFVRLTRRKIEYDLGESL